MTTQRTYNLDRIITREIEIEVLAPGVSSFTWGEHSATPLSLRDGTWRRDADRMLTVAIETTRGGNLPIDLTAPLPGVTVDVDGSSATRTVTAFRIIRDLFNARPLEVELTFDADLPAAGDVLELGIPTGPGQTITTTTTVNVWCSRRDFRGQDFTTVVGDGTGVVGIEDRRYVVRAESAPWTRGDTFTTEDGQNFQVRGVAQLGRTHLEILSRGRE